MQRLVAAFIAALLLSYSVSAAALAQSDGVRITTSPLPVSLKAKPGQSVSADLRFRNSSDHSDTFKLGLLKFRSVDGRAILEERQPGDDFFDWVHFDINQVTLAANEWVTIKMTISLPDTAAFGYYYAVTFSRQGDNPRGQQTALVGSTATLVLLEADAPGAERDLHLDSFTTDHHWYEFLPVNFMSVIRNSGNVHAAPYGTIYISRGDAQVGQIDLNPAAGNILPQSGRTFRVAWDDGFPLNTEDGLHWDWSKVNHLRFGKYTAHLVAAYDNGQGKDVPLEASIDFWVIPWRLLLAGVAIPVIPALLVYALMRWRFNRRREDW
jgi:hypothetical protein